MGRDVEEVTIESNTQQSTADQKDRDVKSSKNAFTSTKGTIELNEQKFVIRVLKMIGSTLVFVCCANNPCLNEMAIAMPMSTSQNIKTTEVIGTTVIGDCAQSESQRLSEQLSKRFKRQFIVSFNVQLDVINAPLFQRALGDYIRTHASEFA